MLIRFSVENYLCFKEEVTLSLLATGDERHANHVLGGDAGRPGLLRAAGVYGANGHGKTKLVDAIEFLERLVVGGVRNSEYGSVKPFKFSEICKERPSRFQIEFRIGTTDYEFGVVLDGHRIHEEWLFARFNKRVVRLYERATVDRSRSSSGFEFGPKLKRARSPNARFKTEDYLEFLATGLDEKKLFLTEAATKGIEPLREPLQWFLRNIFVISTEATYGVLRSRAHEEADFLSFLSQFVTDADTGIECLELERERVSKSLLEQLSEQTHQDLAERLAGLDPDDEMLIGGIEGPEISLKKGQDGEAYRLNLVARHRSDNNKPVNLDLSDESSGTRRLIDLLPIMANRDPEAGVKVFVVDELDRKLHPLLAYRLLEAILSCSDIQIIFTTHNTLLLDLELFRRDEIWFVQKKGDQSVDLYSLADFKVRPDLDVRRGYLSGRFGAIPFLGNLADLGWCGNTPATTAISSHAD